MRIWRTCTWRAGKQGPEQCGRVLTANSRWSKNFDSETDWNIVTEPMGSVNNRQVKVSRGRFLGGSSGVNGTLCIRGTKQDYDDWGMEEWTGDKMFAYMAKVALQSIARVPLTPAGGNHARERLAQSRHVGPRHLWPAAH